MQMILVLAGDHEVESADTQVLIEAGTTATKITIEQIREARVATIVDIIAGKKKHLLDEGLLQENGLQSPIEEKNGRFPLLKF